MRDGLKPRAPRRAHPLPSSAADPGEHTCRHCVGTWALPGAQGGQSFCCVSPCILDGQGLEVALMRPGGTQPWPPPLWSQKGGTSQGRPAGCGRRPPTLHHRTGLHAEQAASQRTPRSTGAFSPKPGNAPPLPPGMFGKRYLLDHPLCSLLLQAPGSSGAQPGRTRTRSHVAHMGGRSGGGAVVSLCWTETPASGGSGIQDSSTRRRRAGRGSAHAWGPQSEGLCLSRPPDRSAGGTSCRPHLRPFPGALPGSGLP